MKKLLALPLALLLLAATACGDDTTTAAAGAPEPPADGLVIRIDRSGGFLTPEMTFSQVPSVSIYGDGLVLTPGAMIEIYPGPAFVPMFESRIDGEGIARLLERAEELGLLEEQDFGQPPVADAPDTVVTLVTRDGTVVHRANALMEAEGADPSSLSDEQRDARQRLQELVTEIERSAMTEGETTEHVPDAYRVRATAEEPPPAGEDDMEPAPRLRDWSVELPQPADLGECSVIESDAARHLEEVFREADQLTWFTDADDATWRITIRPILPDEEGCPA